MILTDDDKEFLADFENQLSSESVDASQVEEEEPTDTTVEEEEEPTPDPVEKEKEEEEQPTIVTFDNVNNEGSEEEEPEQEDKTTDKEPEVDLQEFYAQVMKPFKANGKTIEIRKAEEAIQLMQMGANYTRKMQDISKHRKTIATLEEHGIKDEQELLFLLDLKNKNPEAIKKFFKDNEIDPFEIDTNSDVNYTPQAHVISEKTLDAREVLDELNSTPEGSKTLTMISDTWDDESTRFMWDNPQAFKHIHEQRVNGVYDIIMNEIERQTILGLLNPNGSLMEKYNTVSNQMVQGHTNSNTEKPIETRVAQRSAQRPNKRAQAASTPRTSKRTSFVLDDLLNLDDDAFIKAMENKL